MWAAKIDLKQCVKLLLLYTSKGKRFPVQAACFGMSSFQHPWSGTFPTSCAKALAPNTARV
jgi:hypothetical protein